MWIAKPLSALNSNEIKLILERKDPPMSQTLTWQQATLAMGAEVYIVLDTQDLVGGFVHTFDGKNFDCTNGPILSWDHPEIAPRHLATFAHAVSRLSPHFCNLSFTPRWESHLAEQRIKSLPIQPSDILEAATLQVPIERNQQKQMERASPRLRRTLTRAHRAGVQTSWNPITPELLSEFVAHMQLFGEEKGFYFPSYEWFKTLVIPSDLSQKEEIHFYLAEAFIPSKLKPSEISRKTQLLISITPSSLYYLFGCDVKSFEEPSLSTAASAHFRVLEESAKLGKKLYDLNGYTHPESSESSYRGVSLFKQQFGGQIVSYLCPQYWISN